VIISIPITIREYIIIFWLTATLVPSDLLYRH